MGGGVFRKVYVFLLMNFGIIIFMFIIWGRGLFYVWEIEYKFMGDIVLFGESLIFLLRRK